MANENPEFNRQFIEQQIAELEKKIQGLQMEFNQPSVADEEKAKLKEELGIEQTALAQLKEQLAQGQ